MEELVKMDAERILGNGNSVSETNNYFETDMDESDDEDKYPYTHLDLWCLTWKLFVLDVDCV